MESFPQQDPQSLTEQDLLRGRDQVLMQMDWIRRYTLQLIESVPHDVWYERPRGADTNLAWQVGHLAVAQYGLMLFRQRGRAPGDLELLPSWLRKKFGKGTTPPQEPGPSPTELLAKMDAIFQQASSEVARLPASILAEPTDMPFTAYPIKLGALLFCPLHESIHAGQIGILRRLHGLDPLR